MIDWNEKPKYYLDKVVDRVKEQKEFTLSLEKQKVGRIITHFSLSVKDNQEQNKKAPITENIAQNRDSDTADMFSGATDSEIKPLTTKASDYFGSLMGNDKNFGMKYGRTWEEKEGFVSLIKLELQANEGVIKYADDLRKFGYASPKAKNLEFAIQ